MACMIARGLNSLVFAISLRIVSTASCVNGKYGELLSKLVGRKWCNTSLMNVNASSDRIGGRTKIFVRPMRSFRSGLNQPGKPF